MHDDNQSRRESLLSRRFRVTPKYRQAALDPRTLAAALAVLAAAAAALTWPHPTGTMWPAVLAFAVAGASAGFANSGST